MRVDTEVPLDRNGGVARNLLVVGVVASLVVVSLAQPSHADHFAGASGAVANCPGGSSGNPGGAVMSDNTTWTWWYQDLDPGTSAALEWNRAYIYDPRPNLAVQMVGSLTANTDMVAYDQFYTTYCSVVFNNPIDPIAGLATCVSLNGANECERHEVRFDLADINSQDDAGDRGLACHELGHGLGLGHRDNNPYQSLFDGCMYTLAGPGYQNHLSTHDRATIDFAYPFADHRPFSWLQAVATSDFDVTDRSANRLDLIVRSTGNSVWHLPYPGAGGWSPPTNMGGTAIGGPSITSWDGQRLDAFARGSDNALWHNANGGGGGAWTGWFRVGGTLTSDPDVTSVVPGRLDVFARGVDGGLYHIFLAGGWSAWENLGGIVEFGPAAASTPDGRTHVVAVGIDAQLYYKQWTGTQWTNFSQVGGQFTSSPDLTALGNRVDVVGRGTDFAMHHAYRVNGAWSGFEGLGGAPLGGPTATWRNQFKFDVIARGNDNYAYTGDWNGSW